jgi:hypothetical protein
VINDVRRFVRGSGTLLAYFDRWIIDGMAVNGAATLARFGSYPVRLLEWGLVQWYMLVIIASLLALCGYYIVK